MNDETALARIMQALDASGMLKAFDKEKLPFLIIACDAERFAIASNLQTKSFEPFLTRFIHDMPNVIASVHAKLNAD